MYRIVVDVLELLSFIGHAPIRLVSLHLQLIFIAFEVGHVALQKNQICGFVCQYFSKLEMPSHRCRVDNTDLIVLLQ